MRISDWSSDVCSSDLVTMRVGIEAPAGRHPVLVDHAQVAESHMGGITITAEREGVPAVQPADVRPAALVAASNPDHVRLLPLLPHLEVVATSPTHNRTNQVGKESCR